MAAALVMASIAAGSAHAEVVVFDNSLHAFMWGYVSRFEVNGTPYLDPTRAADQQDGSGDPSVYAARFYNPAFSGSAETNGYYGGSRLKLATSGQTTMINYEGGGEFVQYTLDMVRTFAPGELVGNGETFIRVVDTFGHVYDENRDPVFFNFIGGAGPKYIGLEFTTEEGLRHYGWVHADNYGQDALAWAYETTPNTPIQIPIPAPGSLALIATGFGAAGMRRRRG